MGAHFGDPTKYHETIHCDRIDYIELFAAGLCSSMCHCHDIITDRPTEQDSNSYSILVPRQLFLQHRHEHFHPAVSSPNG